MATRQPRCTSWAPTWCWTISQSCPERWRDWWPDLAGLFAPARPRSLLEAIPGCDKNGADMLTLPTILLVVAFILFVMAAVGVSGGKINLLAAGLAVWVLAQLTPLLL